MRIKAISQHEVDDLQVCSRALSSAEGVQFVTAPRSVSDLYLNGSAYIIAPIDTSAAKLLWTMQHLPTDGDSVYADIMKSQDIKLWCHVFKIGSFFRTYWLLQVYISFRTQKETFKAPIGAFAGKRMPEIVDALLKLLMAKRAIPHDQADAISELT